MPLTIHITASDMPDVVRDVEAVAPGATVRYFPQQVAFEAAIAAADIVATVRIGADALARAKRLKWVQSWSAGPDHTLTPELAASNIQVTSAKGNGAIPLAEHAMMLMLMLDRDAHRSFRAQAEGRWDRFFHGELNGRTLGIIGTGFTGVDLARKARAFHMRVIGMRRSAGPVEGFDAMYPRAALHAFLAQCDFLVVTAPLTPETSGMLDAAAFAAMKPTAFYVCISRGGIADDGALLEALRDRRIAGAGLDAHAVEPLPSDSPFRRLDNVILTPHHGAVTMGSRQRGLDIFLNNLRRYQRGEALLNLVDKKAGY